METTHTNVNVVNSYLIMIWFGVIWYEPLAFMRWNQPLPICTLQKTHRNVRNSHDFTTFCLQEWTWHKGLIVIAMHKLKHTCRLVDLSEICGHCVCVEWDSAPVTCMYWLVSTDKVLCFPCLEEAERGTEDCWVPHRELLCQEVGWNLLHFARVWLGNISWGVQFVCVCLVCLGSNLMCT